MIFEENKKRFLSYSENVINKIFMSLGIIVLNHSDETKEKLIQIGKLYYESEEGTEYFLDESQKILTSIFSSRGIFMTIDFDSELIDIGKKYKKLKLTEII